MKGAGDEQLDPLGQFTQWTAAPWSPPSLMLFTRPSPLADISASFHLGDLSDHTSAS